jgi:ArsR family transcriptional regulator, arsenate/arsenite/antimonite-responsive transcriptional repressor
MALRGIELDPRQFALISKALADPRRYQILRKIGASSEAPTCSCVCEWLGIAPATVSHHLKELENAGLVSLKRSGKFAHISLRRDVLKAYVRQLSAL